METSWKNSDKKIGQPNRIQHLSCKIKHCGLRPNRSKRVKSKSKRMCKCLFNLIRKANNYLKSEPLYNNFKNVWLGRIHLLNSTQIQRGKERVRQDKCVLACGNLWLRWYRMGC